MVHFKLPAKHICHADKDFARCQLLINRIPQFIVLDCTGAPEDWNRSIGVDAVRQNTLGWMQCGAVRSVHARVCQCTIRIGNATPITNNRGEARICQTILKLCFSKHLLESRISNHKMIYYRGVRHLPRTDPHTAAGVSLRGLPHMQGTSAVV